MPRQLMTIDEQETRDLLATARVGYIAYPSRRGLDLTPVNFRVWNGTIYIRTAADGMLAELAPGPVPVVFVASHLDLLTQSGWSVKVRGQIRGLEGEEPPDIVPEPWTGSPGTVLLGLHCEEVTGRRVG